jgi:thymidine kinase
MAPSINVIIGCMFSGKTSELIKIARLSKIVNKKVLIINYVEDTRYSDDKNKMYTHDLVGIDCIFIKDFVDILGNSKLFKLYIESNVICINEGQFYEGLKKFCLDSVKLGKEIHVCGLDGDYLQQPFGEMLDLIPNSESVIRLNALCKICNDGTHAFFTKRIIESKNTVYIGGKESYIPVCRRHLN